MAYYKVRLMAGRYCLAETENNWIVGCGYNPDRPEGQQWEQGVYFPKTNRLESLLSLHEATEYMLCRIDPSYIPRERLVELATRFKDCANGDEDLEYVKDDMSHNELKFFELDGEVVDIEIDDEEILSDLEKRKKDYELEGVELAPEDVEDVWKAMKNGIPYEDALCKVLSDIREILDNGLEDIEDESDIPNRKEKQNMKLIAKNIEWDTDGEEADLPKEVVIPDGIMPDDEDVDEYLNGYAEEVEDWLSDTYGFCVFGFDLEKT